MNIKTVDLICMRIIEKDKPCGRNAVILQTINTNKAKIKYIIPLCETHGIEVDLGL